MARRVDLTGQKFNSWTVIEFNHRTKYRKSYWLCECECGHRQPVSSSNLKGGNSKQCKLCSAKAQTGKLSHRYKHGKYTKDKPKTLSQNLRPSRIAHGESSGHHSRGSSEYRVWLSMRTRCRNPNADRYKNYGGKGIKVCKRWDKYENFLSDMGRRPSTKHQIDRIDVNGHYEPSNCRWTTTKIQSRNRTDNRLIAFNGETLTMVEWSEKLGINYFTLAGRLGEKGWSVEKSLTTPVKRKKHPN